MLQVREMRKLSNLEIESGFQVSQLTKNPDDYIMLTQILVIHVGKAYQMTGQENPMMVEQSIEMLISDPYRKVNSIIMAIDRGLRGIYGKLYGKLTWNQLQEWITKFDEETAIERETKYSSQTRIRHESSKPKQIGEFTEEQKNIIKRIDDRK